MYFSGYRSCILNFAQPEIKPLYGRLSSYRSVKIALAEPFSGEIRASNDITSRMLEVEMNAITHRPPRPQFPIYMLIYYRLLIGSPNFLGDVGTRVDWFHDCVCDKILRCTCDPHLCLHIHK